MIVCAAELVVVLALKGSEQTTSQVLVEQTLIPVEETMADPSASVEEIMRLEEMAKSADLVKYCVIIVSTVPMMIIYPRLQKYFEKGVMIGSVKG